MLVTVSTVFTACQKDELEAQANQINALEASVDSLSNLLEVTRGELADANETIEDNNAEIAELNSDLVEAGKTILTLEGDNAELTAQIAELQADLAALQAAFDAEAAKLEAATAELAEVTAALASANADNDQLETRLSNAQAEIAAAQAECDSLREQLAAARARVVTVTRTITVGGDASVWSPAFGTQIASFDQTSEVEGHSVSRTVSVTSSVSSTISTEVAEGVDVNEDGDLSDDISRDVTTYTASYDLGSHTVNGDWTVSQDNDAPVADTTAPVITVLTRTGDFTVNRDAGFTSPIEFRSHNTNSNEGVLMLNGSPFDVSMEIVGLAAGTHESVFTATDEAGNSSSLTFTIEVAAVEIPSGTVTDTTSSGTATDTTSGGGSTTPEVDPADVPGAWSYSYVGGSDANWAAGEIDLAGNTLIEFISGVRTRVWTINGERDASTPSDLNASNQEVENKQIRNTSYVTPVVPTWTDGSLSGNFNAAGEDVSSAYTHNVYAQSFTITQVEDILGDYFLITYIGTGAPAADATNYNSLAEAVTAAKAAIVAVQ